MTTGPTLDACQTHQGRYVLHVEATIRNAGPRLLEPGGLRFVVRYSNGCEQRASAPHQWPVAPGETATVIGAVPSSESSITTLESIAGFAWVEAAGETHPIEGTVSVSLLRGTRIEHES